MHIGYARNKRENSGNSGFIDPFRMIMEAGNTSNMAEEFIGEGHLGLLFQDGAEEKKHR